MKPGTLLLLIVLTLAGMTVVVAGIWWYSIHGETLPRQEALGDGPVAPHQVVRVADPSREQHGSGQADGDGDAGDPGRVPQPLPAHRAAEHLAQGAATRPRTAGWSHPHPPGGHHTAPGTAHRPGAAARGCTETGGAAAPPGVVHAGTGPPAGAPGITRSPWRTPP